MTVGFMAQQIKQMWTFNPSRRLALYYAWLLTREVSKKKDKSIPNLQRKIRDVVSVETGELERILQDFEYFGIMKSAETCELSEEAYQQIEEEITHCMGKTEPLPFDGLQIYQENVDKRFSLWIEQGTKFFKNVFSSVPEIDFQEIDIVRKRGRLLIIKTDIYSPYIVIYFINTPRMKQMSELQPLFSYTEEIRYRRIKELEKQGAELQINSFKGISIAAAPSYSASTVTEAIHSEVPTRLLEPVNLSALSRYLLNDHPCFRNEQYQALLDYLDPVKGGMRGGIILSTWIEGHINKQLNDAYKKSNC